jgi:hypothetical protein
MELHCTLLVPWRRHDHGCHCCVHYLVVYSIRDAPTRLACIVSQRARASGTRHPRFARKRCICQWHPVQRLVPRSCRAHCCCGSSACKVACGGRDVLRAAVGRPLRRRRCIKRILSPKSQPIINPLVNQALLVLPGRRGLARSATRSRRTRPGFIGHGGVTAAAPTARTAQQRRQRAVRSARGGSASRCRLPPKANPRQCSIHQAR